MPERASERGSEISVCRLAASSNASDASDKMQPLRRPGGARRAGASAAVSSSPLCPLLRSCCCLQMGRAAGCSVQLQVPSPRQLAGWSASPSPPRLYQRPRGAPRPPAPRLRYGLAGPSTARAPVRRTAPHCALMAFPLAGRRSQLLAARRSLCSPQRSLPLQRKESESPARIRADA